MQVNKDFKEVCLEPRLWRCLFLRDYGDETQTKQDEWQERYRERHVSRAIQREMESTAFQWQHRAFMPRRRFWGSGEWQSTPSRWFPGVIGGDYDLHPMPAFPPAGGGFGGPG